MSSATLNLRIDHLVIPPHRFAKGVDKERKLAIQQHLSSGSGPRRLEPVVWFNSVVKPLGGWDEFDEKMEREERANCLLASDEELQRIIDSLIEDITTRHRKLQFSVEIFEKWQKWKPSKREAKLKSVLREIPTSQNGDIHALFREPNTDRCNKRCSSFAQALLLPHINLTELARSDLLPLFIYSRCHFAPTDFFFIHYHRARELWGLWPVTQVWSSGKVVQVAQDGAWNAKVTDREKSSEIGDRVDFDLPPGIFVLALQIQLQELRFTEDMAELLKDPVPSPRCLLDFRSTASEWTYTAMRNAVVATYLNHPSLGPSWEDLGGFANIQYWKAIENLRALLEDPKHFTRTCRHYCGLAVYNKKAPATHSSSLKRAQQYGHFDDIVVEVLTAAMGTCLEWREILLHMSGTDPRVPWGKVDRSVSLKPDKFMIYAVLKRIQEINLDEMIHLLATSGTASKQTRIWAQETLRKHASNGSLLYEWGNKSRILESLTVVDQPGAHAMLELFGFSKRLGGSPLLPLHSVIEAIEHMLTKKPEEATEFGTSFFIPFDQLAALSTLLQLLQADGAPEYHAVDRSVRGIHIARRLERAILRGKYSAFRTSIMVPNAQPGNLQFPGGPLSRETIDIRITSESILDQVWGSFRRHLEQHEGFKWEQAVMNDVYHDWAPERTPPFKEQVRKASSQETKELYCWSQMPAKTESEPMTVQSKVKTRGKPGVNDAERPNPTEEVFSDDEPPLTVVTKAKHCIVLRQFFQCSSPLPWRTVVSAMASIGFCIKPSSKGWRLMPPPEIGKSPIFFHDRHGQEIEPALAMAIGRRLHDRYGLTIDSFRSDEGSDKFSR